MSPYRFIAGVACVVAFGPAIAADVVPARATSSPPDIADATLTASSLATHFKDAGANVSPLGTETEPLHGTGTANAPDRHHAAPLARARSDPSSQPYDVGTFAEQARAVRWEASAALASTLAIGFVGWDWGSSKFSFANEGFFGTDTANGGMDKLGHAYSAALMADLFTDLIDRRGGNPRHAAVTGVILSATIMTTIEIFDGFSEDYGFAPQDMVANAAGLAFAYVTNTVPGLDEKLDFRLEYVPSGERDRFSPQSDYAGQKYLLAVKLSGFDRFEDTPLEHVELHAGYFARGFTSAEERRGVEFERTPYVGVGIDIGRLVFGRNDDDGGTLERIGRQTLEYVQPPFSYATYETDAYRY